MTQDTRKDRRVKIVSLNVRYKSATVDEFIENHAHDVSRGGIFIKTANPFPPGTLLKFEIRLANDQAVIAGVGRIVWKRDPGVANGNHPAGMGVKFIKIDDPSKVVIDKLVNTRTDAGKAYESQDQTTRASDRPGSQAPRPGLSPLPPRVAEARSMSPAPGATSPSKEPGQKSRSTPAGTPVARKATMMGLGISSTPRPLSSPPGSPSHAAPDSPSDSPPGSPMTATARPPPPPFASAPSVAPRPGTGTGTPMFPKMDRITDGPPKQEQTVMKQAAELLEEALREAGGSMEEIGTNPLFSGTSATPGAHAQKLGTPATPASEWTTAETPQALAATVAARREAEEAAAAQAQAAMRRAETVMSMRAPEVRARSSQKAGAKKGTIFALVGVAAAAILVAGVMMRDRLLGEAAPAPDSVATPSPKAEVPATTPTIPTAGQAVTAAPPMGVATSATSEAPAKTAIAQPPASAIPSGAAAAGASNATAAAAPPAPRPPRPAARPVPPAAPPNEGTATTNTTAAPVATEAAAAPPPKPAAPLPKPKPAKPPADDNPY